MSASAMAQPKVNINEDGVALNGYDVVAYHLQNDAIRGSKVHSTTHEGVTYYFSSVKNLEDFKSSPKKYLPKYGGYCAFAVAMKGAAVPVDPHTFKLHDGDLYLFFNDLYEGAPFNTIIPWNADEKNLIPKADASWKKLSASL